MTRPEIIRFAFGGIVRYRVDLNGRNIADFPTRERAEAHVDRYMNRDQMRADFAAKIAKRTETDR